jgi:hypothetical protein
MLLGADDRGMFVTDCQACGLRELRGPRSIELLVNTDHGADLVYRCTRCSTVNALHPQPVAQPRTAPLVAA